MKVQINPNHSKCKQIKVEAQLGNHFVLSYVSLHVCEFSFFWFVRTSGGRNIPYIREQ